MRIHLQNVKNKLIAASAYPDTDAGYTKLDTFLKNNFSNLTGWAYDFVNDVLSLDTSLRGLSSAEKTFLRNLRTMRIMVETELEDEIG